MDAPEQQLEYIYHLVNSGDTYSLGDVLDENGRSLGRSGHMELLPLLIELQESQFGPRTWATVLEMRGDILAMQGRWDDAETEYESCLPIVKRHKMREMEGRLLSSKADLSVHRGTPTPHSIFMGVLCKSSSIPRMQKVQRVHTPTWVTFSGIEKIRSVRLKSMVTSKSYSNLKMILSVESRIKLASALLEMGEIDRAREHALTSYEDTEAAENKGLHARARAVLGRLYARTGDPDLALHHYSEALTQMSGNRST